VDFFCSKVAGPASSDRLICFGSRYYTAKTYNLATLPGLVVNQIGG